MIGILIVIISKSAKITKKQGISPFFGNKNLFSLECMKLRKIRYANFKIQFLSSVLGSSLKQRCTGIISNGNE